MKTINVESSHKTLKLLILYKKVEKDWHTATRSALFGCEPRNMRVVVRDLFGDYRHFLTYTSELAMNRDLQFRVSARIDI